MILDARQAPEYSLWKIKKDYNRPKFWDNKQKSENSTAKPLNFTLKIYQKRSQILLVYIKDLNVSSFLLPPDLVNCNVRLTNGLFHSRYPGFHANEKIIILKLELSE